MNRRRYLIFAAAVVISGVSPLLAQDPPNIVRIIREDIKPGRSAAHEKVEMGYVRAFSKSKYGHYLALETITGPGEAWFVEPYESYAALENSIRIAESQPLKSELDQLDAQDGEMRTGGRNMIATYQKAFSYRPGPADMGKARYVSISVLRIRPGRNGDFAERTKLLNEAFEKSKNPQGTAVYSVASGAPAGTFLVFRGMTSLKSMDPDSSRMSMADAFGQENLARFQKLQQEVILSNENILFGINPRMSYPPKEFVTSDPDFWAPKPKTAAKPTGTQ
jgi:hypothetical protein